ncbi:histidine kinase [Oxalobacteraceae bacterium OTU3CINTB1]|nr:histidine kinase [Oxalobacteraceae bacterium OTU3CINTB1]
MIGPIFHFRSRLRRASLSGAPARALLALLLWMAAGLAPFASATEIGRRMSPVIELLHTSWTARDGAPAGISGITQTPDGWIWIGSSSGLYKFDGVRFLRASGEDGPLTSAVSAIGLLRDGTLWVGYKYGGFSMMTKGRMKHFRLEQPDTPRGTIFDAAEDDNGRLWVATSGGLFYLDGDARWHHPERSSDAPQEYALALLFDRGVLWVRSSQGIYSLARGADKFVQRNTDSVGWLARHPDGSVWTSDGRVRGLQMLAGPAQGKPLRWNIDDLVGRFFFDHDGYTWFVSAPDLVRTAHAGLRKPSQRTWPERGLSGVEAYALFQDREQNVWVGTENGLDRFRAPRLETVKLPKNAGITARPIAGGPGASAWVDRSYLPAPNAPARPFAPELEMGMVNTALYRAADGNVWMGGDEGPLFVLRDGVRQRVALPPGIDVNRFVYSLTEDRAGALWISFGRAGFYTLRAGQWALGGGIAGMATFAASVIAADPRGPVWLGSVNNHLAVVADGRVRHYGKADGVTVGTVMQILPVAGGAWIGGENGLAYFDGSRFHPIVGAEGDPLAGITGLIFGRDGTLWINGGSGITSIGPKELARVVREPRYAVRFDRLDYRDGLTGSTSPLFPLPSAARSDDGTLWFSTTGGVYAFQPEKLPRNALVPPVVVTSLHAGEAAYATTGGARLPAGTRALEIDFTALSYQDPERMRFQYRLEGVDGAWRDGGSRRSASYTNLGPGKYTFRVIASNNDGVWNLQGASVSFYIEPKIMQTMWFRALCVVAALLLLWRLYVFKARLLARRYGELMQERLAERERIARALHDTLLQGLHGVVLRVASVAKRLPPESQERGRIDAILDQAGTVMAQGRDELMNLRTAPAAGDDIAAALSGFGQSLERDFGPRFAIAVPEGFRPLDAIARPAIYCIGREALFNAYRHAAASHVEVALGYGSEHFVLSIADDGVGMPGAVLDAGGREGHWGLTGMRERAAALGGSLDIANQTGGGTRIVLTVPASRAYMMPEEFNIRRWLRAIVHNLFARS